MRPNAFPSDPRDRARSAAATAAIHVALGVAFLTGVAIKPERRTDDSLKTFDVEQPSPPPPMTEIRPIVESAPAPAGPKADPSPIVAPPAWLPSPQSVAAAPAAGTGSSANAGGAATGTGTGAGGSGDGGNGAGRTGARLVSGGLGRRDYRQIAAMGSTRGNAELLLLINPAGRVEQCRAMRSSGDTAVDNALCQTLLERARFAPAREADGSPLYQDVRYFPIWRR